MTTSENMTKTISKDDEIKKLKEKVDDLEFTNLFLTNKLEENENKRLYYRMDREKKFNSLFENRIRLLNEEEQIEEKLRIKNMTIHEKYEYIDGDYLELRNLRYYIMNEEPFELYKDDIRVAEAFPEEAAKERVYVSKPKNVLKKIMIYFTEGEYEEKLSDEIVDNWECNGFPQSVSDTCIECAMDSNEIVSSEYYDEKYDECHSLNIEIEEADELIKKRCVKSYGEEMNTNHDLKDNINLIFDKMDEMKIDIQKFKSGYETLKECNEEKDMIDMMEKIMNKTEEVAKKDIKRVEEINRLKWKSNHYLSLCELAEKEFITTEYWLGGGRLGGGRYNTTPMFKYINLYKEWFEDFWRDTLGKEIVISNELMNTLQSIIRSKLNEFLKNDTALKEDIISQLIHYDNLFTKEKNIEKSNLYNWSHYKDDKYADVYKKKMLNENPINNKWKHIDYEKEEEEIKDIHNY